MGTITGKLVDIDQKTSKKGKPYYRVNIEANGQRQWWTYFGEFKDGSLGQECLYATRQMGDGEIIDEYTIVAPGAPLAPSQASIEATKASYHAAVSAPPSKVGGHRDMWIMAECIYQHWIDSKQGELCGQVEDADIEHMVKESVRLAMWANEQFKAYDAGKLHETPKQTERNLLSERVEDIAGRAKAPPMEQPYEEFKGHFDDEFADDIPF